MFKSADEVQDINRISVGGVVHARASHVFSKDVSAVCSSVRF